MLNHEVHATVDTSRLLWAACRAVPDRADVANAVDGGADLRVAVAAAVAQKVGPLLWRALAEADRLDRLTGPSRDLLQRDFEIHRGQAALVLPGAVAMAVEPLTHAGLQPLVFKGPALAGRYPEPGLRPMDDIDLMLAPDQHAAGLAALQQRGWRVWTRPGDHYDTVLQHPDVREFPLELHRGLESWRDRANRLSATDLWRARVPIDCFGTAAFGLRPEDELVALAAHAGKPFHHFERLIWSVDLAVVVAAAAPALDWDHVARRARRTGCSTVLAVGLRQARRLGADIPEPLLALPSSRLRQSALAPVLDEVWPLVVAEDSVRHQLRYALSDSYWCRAAMMVGEVTADGPRRLPGSTATLALMAVRRWWTWHRTGSLADDGQSADGTRAPAMPSRGTGG